MFEVEAYCWTDDAGTEDAGFLLTTDDLTDLMRLAATGYTLVHQRVQIAVPHDLVEAEWAGLLTLGHEAAVIWGEGGLATSASLWSADILVDVRGFPIAEVFPNYNPETRRWSLNIDLTLPDPLAELVWQALKPQATPLPPRM